MKTISLGKMAQVMDGKLIQADPAKLVQSVNFGNPKSLTPHQVYFFTRKLNWSKEQLPAIQRIKPIAVVLPPHISSYALPREVGLIRTQDTFAAFWKIAKWNWGQCKQLRVIGITGSAGKSTTTEMVASILKYRGPMVKTQGNLNTFSFLPSYLARLTPRHKLLLLEMGMKSLNNIIRQCKIVKPEIGVVTNVGEAHAGALGGLDLVVKAKQEMVDGVRPGGVLILNADNARSRKLNISRFSGSVYSFGIHNPAHIKGSNIRYTQTGMSFTASIGNQTFPVHIPTYGTHNVYNALAAIGVAWAYGASVTEIQKGLSTFQAPKMRLQFISGRHGRILINDAWNANPTAMKAGLEVLKNVGGSRPKIAVLGNMLELGSYTKAAHEHVGRYVASLELDQLITLGKYGRLIAQAAVASGMDKRKVFSYSEYSQVVNHLVRLPKNAIIYFKASRNLHLEKIVKQLK
jgi:UDP-N-acetylmuramoyl-tripeptide--D-alanyl-D-alanine ligase